MPLTTNISFDVPGVYVSEDTYGSIPASLASFNSVYMLGYSTKAGAPVNQPTFIQSSDDFFNVFGTSQSASSVELFFNQRSGSGLYFINVAPKATYTVAIGAATAGTAYTLTIDSYPVTYTAVAGDTTATVLAGLSRAVNTQASHIAFLSNGVLRVSTGTTVTASASLTLGVVSAAPSYPVVGDVVQTINTAFDSELRQGFLIAPEFFQAFTVAADRAALASSMEALCSDPQYNWMALLDCGSATATTTTQAGAVNLAIAERNFISSARGHSAYFFPYWVNFNKVNVPMSASVAGVALRRFRQQGYRQPPAGVQFPVYGVTNTSYQITDKNQALLNPLGINCGRKLPAGRGTVIYGARTISSSPFYRFMNTRIIMNVLDGTLAKAFDDLVLSAVDGQGALFARIKQTCIGVCEDLRSAGALYGATPEAAYLVICDTTNNSTNDLESGKVSVDVIVKPSPIMEVLHVRVSRASLGTSLTEILGSGDIQAIRDIGKDEGIANSTAPKNP